MVLIIQLVRFHPWWFSEYSPVEREWHPRQHWNWPQENPGEKERDVCSTSEPLCCKHNWGDQWKWDTLSAFARSSVPVHAALVQICVLNANKNLAGKGTNARSQPLLFAVNTTRKTIAREIHFQSLPDLQFPLSSTHFRLSWHCSLNGMIYQDKHDVTWWSKLVCYCHILAPFDRAPLIIRSCQIEASEKTLPEAQRTQKLTRDLSWLQIWQPDGATCISCTIWPPDGATCISYIFGHQVSQLGLV